MPTAWATAWARHGGVQMLSAYAIVPTLIAGIQYSASAMRELGISVRAAIGQILPEESRIVGHFGVGSDTAIILNYAADAIHPSVRRLLRLPNGTTDWVRVAKLFDEFARVAGSTANDR